MRPNNRERQNRLRLLSERLGDIAIERDHLLRQLEILDSEARTVQLEHNTLKNLVAPISALTDDALSMIFEAGMHVEQGRGHHFGPLVSHVARHWRRLALAIPALWTNIQFLQLPPWLSDPNRYKFEERAAAFLARSRSLPVCISVTGFREKHFTGDFLRLIAEHIGHCRYLSLRGSSLDNASMFLAFITHQTTPLLRSIELTGVGDEDDEGLEEDAVNQQWLLPSLHSIKLPHLRAAQLAGFKTLDFLLPFRSVTSLRFTGIWIQRDQAYETFRDGLMSLQSLNHLELQLQNGFGLDSGRFPMVLPTISFLRIDAADCPSHVNTVLDSIQAESLISLTLTMWDIEGGGPHNFTTEKELHFPLLHHLILEDIPKDFPNLDSISRKFPGIKRLTCQVANVEVNEGFHADHMLTAIFCGYDGPPGTVTQWPELQTLALSQPETPLALQNMTCMLQNVGHPIRELMLPQCSSLLAGDVEQAMMELRKLVNVMDYSLDWPMPFELFT